MSSAISLPFSFDADGRIGNTSDLKKIIQDRVVLVVMSLKTERVMRPNYGTNVRRSVFENVAAATSLIKQEISVGMSTWLPYLHLDSVDVSFDGENYLNITINYRYGSSTNAETVIVRTATLTQSGDIITEVPYGQQ